MEHTILERKDCGLKTFACETPQFKTARHSVHLVLPLTTPEAAAANAIVPNVSARATRAYPDYTCLLYTSPSPRD